VSARPRPRQLFSPVDPWDRNANLAGNVVRAFVATPAASVHEDRVPVVVVVVAVAVFMVVPLGSPALQIVARGAAVAVVVVVVVAVAVFMVVPLGSPALQIVAKGAVGAVADSLFVRLGPLHSKMHVILD
jgi:purine-cytosine permease-like protein